MFFCYLQPFHSKSTVVLYGAAACLAFRDTVSSPHMALMLLNSTTLTFIGLYSGREMEKPLKQTSSQV